MSRMPCRPVAGAVAVASVMAAQSTQQSATVHGTAAQVMSSLSCRRIPFVPKPAHPVNAPPGGSAPLKFVPQLALGSQHVVSTQLVPEATRGGVLGHAILPGAALAVHWAGQTYASVLGGPVAEAHVWARSSLQQVASLQATAPPTIAVHGTVPAPGIRVRWAAHACAAQVVAEVQQTAALHPIVGHAISAGNARLVSKVLTVAQLNAVVGGNGPVVLAHEYSMLQHKAVVHTPPAPAAQKMLAGVAFDV